MTQGAVFRKGKTAPSFFMPFFGKQARKGGIHGERTAGGISGAVPHGSSQRRHQPGVALLITVLSINFLGDGIRDALDPKIKL